MKNTGYFSLIPIPIPIQYNSLIQQYQYNPNTNTLPIYFNDSVLFVKDQHKSISMFLGRTWDRPLKKVEQSLRAVSVWYILCI